MKSKPLHSMKEIITLGNEIVKDMLYKDFPLLNTIKEWSVINHGVFLYLDSEPRNFVDGISLDVEDDERGNCVGLGIYDATINACFYWSDFSLARKIRLPKFIAHNGVSDIKKLMSWGFQLDESWLLADTMLMAHLYDSSKKSYGLKPLVKELFNAEYPSYEDITGKKTKKQNKPRLTLDKQPLELVSEYNAADCYWTYRVYEYYDRLLKTIPKSEFYLSNIENPTSFVFKTMSDKGVNVDINYLKDLKKNLENQKAPIEKFIKNELGNINLNSPVQLLEALNAKEIRPTFKGKPSTDKRALQTLQGKEIVAQLLRFSELETLISSFITPYLERNEKVVHPRFNQCGTRTGRPSCSNPNLLQIPRRTENGKLVRRMFVARERMLFGDCDFGQIEPRVLAHLSQDENMLDMFNQGIDFHSYTAEKIFGNSTGQYRERAKILNLSVGYKATFRSVSQQLKCSWTEAQKEIDKWWSVFPQLKDWQDKLIYLTKRKGYCETLFGRRIKIEELDSPNEWRREGAERQLINNITQGSAQEIMKMAMLGVHKAGIDILIQVYDELLCELPEESASADIEKIADICVNSTQLSVPLTVDSGIGKTWADCKG